MKEAIKKSVFFPNLTAPAGMVKSGHGAGEAGPYRMAGAKAKILFELMALRGLGLRESRWGAAESLSGLTSSSQT